MQNEQNFKIHVAILAVVLVAAYVLACTETEWILLCICAGTVITLEMMNTAVERVCNAYSRDYNPAVKIIKDVAAGAVLFSAAIAAVCGCIIFVPKIIFLFHHSL